MKHKFTIFNVSDPISKIVFGAEDGFVTALGTVLAVSAATSDSRLVIIAGIASLFAEAISMLGGSYLSAKTKLEIEKRGEDPLRVAILFWIATMVGIIAVMPFLFFDVNKGVIISVILTLASLFIIGALKTKFTKRSWLAGGIEMMSIGGLAAIVGYSLGIALSVVV